MQDLPVVWTNYSKRKIYLKFQGSYNPSQNRTSGSPFLAYPLLHDSSLKAWIPFPANKATEELVYYVY